MFQAFTPSSIQRCNPSMVPAHWMEHSRAWGRPFGENDGCLKSNRTEEITSVFFWRWFQYIYICFNMPEYVSMDVTTCFNPALIIRQEKVSQAPGWANQATGAVLSHEWRGSSPVCCSFSPAESSRASHAAGKRNAQWWGMMPASEGFGRTF